MVHCHSERKRRIWRRRPEPGPGAVLQILHSACGSVQDDKRAPFRMTREVPFRMTKGLKRFDNSLRIEYSKEELRLTSRKNKKKGDDFHF